MNERKAGIFISYINIFLHTLIGFLYVPLLLFYIGSGGYGLYQLIGSFIAYFSIMDFGLTTAIVRFYAKYKALNDRVGMENILAISSCGYAVISLVILCIGGVCYFCLDSIFAASMTIAEIKDGIAGDFMRNEDVARAYGFEAGDSFTAHFSKASVESVLFYIFACAAWIVESLFDEHRREVNSCIEEILPHRPKWYRDKVLAFMKDKILVADTDYYDTAGMSDADIEAARVVKYAAATESSDASLLTIKVAGENGGVRQRLDGETETQLAAYIAEFKDAGVRINLVNIDADTFNCEVDIYYDPMLLPEEVEGACRETVRAYIEDLPFNGEYTNMALVDELQKVEGVKIVEFRGATTSANGETAVVPINARHVPVAGYFKAGTITINRYVYE